VLLTRLCLRVVHSDDDQSLGRLLPILVLE
jgi:hypothetical protein